MKALNEETLIPAMSVNSLDDLVAWLVGLDPSDSPLVSAYIDLTQPRETQIEDVRQRGAMASLGLRGQPRRDFDDALGEIIDYLERRKSATKKSLAVFSRWGDEPLFAVLEMDAPLESQVLVDQLPMIYPLVALKDKLHRFVVVITSEAEARILEVVIGQVTESMITKRPDLRKRIGREWTKEHFQSYKQDRHAQFLKQKVSVIEQLMAKKGYNHLVVLGSATNVARLQGALPKHIQDRVIDPSDHGAPSGVSDPVKEAILLFIDAEERESQTTVSRLHASIMSNGLGAVGHDAVLRALLSGQADTLVILDDYPMARREELVRAAIQAKVNVETVGRSKLLDQYGGVGCLLRYRLPS